MLFADESVELVAMEQKLPVSSWLVGLGSGMGVRCYVGISQVGFAATDSNKGAFETSCTSLDAFYLGTAQRDPGRNSFGKIVIKGGSAIFREDFHDGYYTGRRAWIQIFATT